MFGNATKQKKTFYCKFEPHEVSSRNTLTTMNCFGKRLIEILKARLAVFCLAPEGGKSDNYDNNLEILLHFELHFAVHNIYRGLSTDADVLLEILQKFLGQLFL